MKMRNKIELLDTIALLEDLPQRNLKKGEVGTVVEILSSNVFEIEFSDDEGQTYAMFALRENQIVTLHNQGKGLKIAA